MSASALGRQHHNKLPIRYCTTSHNISFLLLIIRCAKLEKQFIRRILLERQWAKCNHHFEVVFKQHLTIGKTNKRQIVCPIVHYDCGNKSKKQLSGSNFLSTSKGAVFFHYLVGILWLFDSVE